MLHTLTPITAALLAGTSLPGVAGQPLPQSPAAVQAPALQQGGSQTLRAKSKKRAYLTPLLLQRASWARSTALFRGPATPPPMTTRASYNRLNNGQGPQGPQVPVVPAGSATIPIAPQPISIYIP
ncbi:MAG: hypothetical protein ACON4Z_02695 [Planctomycetota bacterium]